MGWFLTISGLQALPEGGVEGMPARVLIALGQKMYREGVRDALTARLGITVVGEAGDGRGILSMARELRPDVVVLQARMPEMNGAEVTRQLATECPGLPVIAISTSSDYTLIMRMLKAGARGFVLVSGGLDELESAMHAIDQGKVYISPAIETTVIESLSVATPTAEEKLTRREIEVLQLIAEGKSTKRIAEILAVSTKTIETHRLHIMAKLQLYSIAELTKYAIRQGITTDTE